jgi:hypothetical protein
MPRATVRPLTIVVEALAVVTFILVVIRAWRVVDPYWDTLQYHWAYAARAAGLCNGECLAFDSGLDARYHGFPMLFHWAFGMLWRLTGTPLAGHLLSVGALVAVCTYLRRRFAVPLAWSWLALLAVPLVQIHVTASYADLAANSALAIGILALFSRCLRARADTSEDLVVAAIALGIAAGSKLQLIPAAALTWTAIALVDVADRRRRAGTLAWGRVAVLAIVGVVAILPQAALNTWHFGNPFYPIAFTIGGHTFPGTETVDLVQRAASLGTPWKDTPSPLRWLASVLEYDAFEGRDVPWTIDQGNVPQSSASFRMGGYFVTYVLALLAVLLATRRPSPRRPVWLVLASTTIVCALLPNSHELRYYLFWMLVLVAMALIVRHAPEFAAARVAAVPAALDAAILVVFASVVAMTGARYLRTSGERLDDLVAPTNATLAALHAGETLCVANLDRHAILYSRAFHPSSGIDVRMLQNAVGAGCSATIAPH